jgi:hypothetical protein
LLILTTFNLESAFSVLILQPNHSDMKALFALMVVILLVGCQGTRQKAIQTLCKEVGKNTSNCTKTVGLISASVVENRLINSSNTKQENNSSPSLLEAHDSFSW